MKFFDRSKPMNDKARCLIPGLPDEIGLLCLAKLSLSNRHAIRSVCTSWRNVFNEKFFWDGRRSETLYLFQTCCPDGHHAWHCLHPLTNDWIKLPAMPYDGEFRGGSASAVIDEKLYLVGGWSANPEDDKPHVSSDGFFFDLKAWHWSRTASLNIARANCTVGIIKNQLYVCGGDSDEGLTSTAEVYDPTSQAWTLIASMKSPLEDVQGIVIDEKLYVTCAITLERRPLIKGFVYDPHKDEWSDMPKKPLSYLCMIFPPCPVFFNGQLYVKIPSRYKAGGPRPIKIFRYDVQPDVDNIKCFSYHDQVLTNEEDFPTLGYDLLVFEGELCIVCRYLRSGRLQYVIKDLKNSVVASSKPLFLFTQDDAQPHSWSGRGSWKEDPHTLVYQTAL